MIMMAQTLRAAVSRCELGSLSRHGRLLAAVQPAATCSSCRLLHMSLRRQDKKKTTTQRFTLDARDKDHQEKEQKLTMRYGSEYFDDVAKKAKDKRTFEAAIAKYLDHQRVYRRGLVEFAYASLEKMKEFGVHRDLATYKQLFELFPKGKMVARSPWQVEMMHYPKQQQCGIDILDYMESNGVIPDDEMGYQLIEIYGQEAHVFRKYQRMMYWMPKFKYADPYYVPPDLPDDREEMAKYVLKKMAVDLENKINVFQTEELLSASDHTFVASAQSPVQQALLSQLPRDEPVSVEGGFITWLRSHIFIYYTLKAPTTQKWHDFEAAKHTQRETEGSKDWKVTEWNIFEEEKPASAVSVPPSVHEQEDGTVLAMCVTGTSSKDSLASWIKFLERDNPHLASVPVVFKLRSPYTGTQSYLEEGEGEEEGLEAVEGEKNKKAISDT